MEVKKKVCYECGELKVIWKNYEGEKYCKHCWMRKSATVNKIKPTKQYRIPSRSPKKIKKDALYAVLRKDYLDNHPLCQLRIPGLCTNQATEIHHTYAGANRDKYYLDTRTWKSGCRACHDWVHAHPIEAKELEYLK